MTDKLLEILEKNFRYDPLYPLAMLKISSELKGTIWAGVERIIQDTLKELEISEDRLNDYLTQHKAELVQVSQELGI